MTVQEKIERLKREKTSYSTEELDRLGWARYQEIQEELEAKHHGEYVVIEVDSGDYFVGETAEEAFRQAEAVHPDKVFCLIRIGYKAVHKLKRAPGSGLEPCIANMAESKDPDRASPGAFFQSRTPQGEPGRAYVEEYHNIAKLTARLEGVLNDVSPESVVCGLKIEKSRCQGSNLAAEQDPAFPNPKAWQWGFPPSARRELCCQVTLGRPTRCRYGFKMLVAEVPDLVVVG